MTKKVYLETLGGMHVMHERLVAFPPAGYEFVQADTLSETLVKTTMRWDFSRFLVSSASTVVPTGLLKSWLGQWSKPPAGTALTYTVDHLVFRPEPWVLEVNDFAGALVQGNNPAQLIRYKRIVERSLASSQCRKIRCWSEASRRSLLEDMNSEGFQHKIEVIYYSSPANAFTKDYNEGANKDGKIKLLFVGSGASAGIFEAGAWELFEAFALLCQRYENLELLVRSGVPANIKARYGGMQNLRILEDLLPWEVLEYEYKSADIYIHPTYNTSPATFLDAMRYELPIVTIDSWANAEYVEEGKTGLVAPASEKMPRYYKNTHQPTFFTPEFVKTMRTPDHSAAEELAGRVATLIEDAELRRQMGKAGRWEVEQGKFSQIKVNEKLGRMFDEAIDGNG